MGRPAPLLPGSRIAAALHYYQTGHSNWTSVLLPIRSLLYICHRSAFPPPASFPTALGNVFHVAALVRPWFSKLLLRRAMYLYLRWACLERLRQFP